MKISIVIPSFNQADFVEAALLSVISQDYQEKEILFIDGGSTDGTMEIVEKYRPHLACCISEPDGGQSDALRKGFDLASGNVLTWLNTDDLLMPGALKEAAAMFKRNATTHWVFGNVIWINANDQILRLRKGESFHRILPRLGVLTACGPTAFFTRELYFKVGGVNPSLHYMMDTDLWWRFALSGTRFYRLTHYTWALRLHDKAKMSAHHFVDPIDEKRKSIESKKSHERNQIRTTTEVFRLPTPDVLNKLIRAFFCLSNLRYVTALFESRRWQGKTIHDYLGRNRSPLRQTSTPR